MQDKSISAEFVHTQAHLEGLAVLFGVLVNAEEPIKAEDYNQLTNGFVGIQKSLDRLLTHELAPADKDMLQACKRTVEACLDLASSVQPRLSLVKAVKEENRQHE